MAHTRWDKGLETGNDLIDSQHRELNAFVNELRAFSGGPRTEVLGVLDKVMDFAADHLLLEEELMRQVDYPPEATRRMVQQHQEFKERARSMVLSYRRDEMLGLLPIRLLLEEFLAAHESGEDRLLADWIREHKAGSPLE